MLNNAIANCSRPRAAAIRMLVKETNDGLGPGSNAFIDDPQPVWHGCSSNEVGLVEKGSCVRKIVQAFTSSCLELPNLPIRSTPREVKQIYTELARSTKPRPRCGIWDDQPTIFDQTIGYFAHRLPKRWLLKAAHTSWRGESIRSEFQSLAPASMEIETEVFNGGAISESHVAAGFGSLAICRL